MSGLAIQEEAFKKQLSDQTFYLLYLSPAGHVFNFCLSPAIDVVSSKMAFHVEGHKDRRQKKS